jgi:2-keto-myo-inositol isomerase
MSRRSDSFTSPYLPSLCLNTSTISGHKLSLPDAIHLAADAGYDAIEPWVRELDAHVAAGGSLRDIAKLARDRGIRIANLIGFAEWIVDEPDRRAKGLEEAKRSFAQAAELGCPRVAAPPFGCHNRPGPPLPVIVERYAELQQLARSMGVTTVLEFWGFSRTLSTLGEAIDVAVRAGDASAQLLVDPYHLYKGGSNVEGLSLLRGSSIGMVHINDFPAITREKITDADRVYPADGTAPLKELLRTLCHIGYRGDLSLELFNASYWKRPASDVAKEGLAKMRSLVEAALGCNRG